MYRLTTKRNGWIVLRAADRKQTHKGIFRLKSEAVQHMNNLLNQQAIAEPSNYNFVDAFTAFVKERFEIANNKDLALTIGGVQGYASDLNLRIKPYMPNISLSEFKLSIMKEFLLKCHAAGHKYKTLIRTVRNIKSFLNVMKSEGKNPCLDMLAFDIGKFYAIKPTNYEDQFEKKTHVIDNDQVSKILTELNLTKDKNYKSAISFALVCILFLTGLRRSEIKGLLKSKVDLQNGILTIDAIYIAREGGRLKRTKNVGSFRDIDLDENAIKFFTWWLDYLKKHHPHNPYLFPSFRTYGPLSDKGFSNTMWSIYEKMNLAKLEWKRGHCTVIDSPFKGAPSKTFRHRLATMLIETMAADHRLTANYVKSVVGHTRFSTTADRYGNHNSKINKFKTLAKAEAIGSHQLKLS